MELGLGLSRGFRGANNLVVDAQRDDAGRFIMRADEKLTAFVELESTIRGSPSFTPSAPLRNTGRASISERVALLGGTMQIGSCPSGGLALQVEIPTPSPS